MGDQNVRVISSKEQMNVFTRHLLRDIHALERMIDEGWFEDEPTHIGAEQEICLVDQHCKPATKSLQILDQLNDPDFTTELAQFNMELNLPPLKFTGNCLSQLENSIQQKLIKLEKICDQNKLKYILTGILPTIRKLDLDIENLTPLERYQALIKAISKMRGKSFELKINGLDELHLKLESAMLESCNTSFQIHFQVHPDRFVRKYNIAQALAAPVLAVSCNSPILFGKRLWSETRIALFQQSIDTRVTGDHIRERSPRVTFGKNWLENSIVDMYQEDVARFRVLLMTNFEHNVMDLLDQGITPKLKALSIHNSTVYRWNRPCYGISANGKPHLRIENRVLPSGPTVIDEVANAAFWFGTMTAFDNAYHDVTQHMEFAHAKDNFFSAARDGLSTDFTWMGGRKINVKELIKKELIPMAREGLTRNKIDQKDIDRYMEVIEARVESGQTGTQWMINSHTHLMKSMRREDVSMALASSMIHYQQKKKPIHEWKLADSKSVNKWHPTSMRVEEFMTTDVFTAQENDIPELVADIIHWKKLKHIPIEDNKGILKGMVNYDILLSHFSKKSNTKSNGKAVIRDLMNANPVVVAPEATIQQALQLMNDEKVDCLPVVKNKKLVGIISEGNFVSIAANLLNNFNKT